MSEMNKMNVAEIMEYLNGMESRELRDRKMPFDLVSQCVSQTLADCVGIDGKINYVFLRLFKTINITEASLLSMGIEYVKSDFEEDDTPEYFKIYDELTEVYMKIISNTSLVFTINEILESAIAQMEREQVALGMFESRILGVAEKFTATLENISGTIGDKKKLKSVLQLVKKEIPELGNMISGIKDGVGSKGKDDVSV